jgi:hypothetical protein
MKECKSIDGMSIARMPIAQYSELDNQGRRRHIEACGNHRNTIGKSF